MLLQTEFTNEPKASGLSIPDCRRVFRTRRKVSWVTSWISSGARSRDCSLMASSSPKYNEIALGFGVAMDEPAHVFGIEALTLHYDRYYTSKHRPAREKGFAHRPPNLCG